MDSGALPLDDEYTAKIKALDLVRLKTKLSEKKGWAVERIARTETEYLRFLYLLAKYPEEIIVPWSEDLDEFWHQHILYTRQYPRDCQTVFGRFIHHDPYIEADPEKHKKAWTRTQELYAEEFWAPVAN